jgi:hypothetical protein
MAPTDEKQGIATQSAGLSNGPPETYCPICGKDAADPSLKRFGEYFCSEEHVAEYAREVRSTQARESTSITAVAGAQGAALQTTGTPKGTQTPQTKGGISGFWKMAACCGGMLLLLPALGLVSVGGLAAVAGSLLTVAAVLACPIGMYIMMRGMIRQEHHGEPRQGDGRDRPPLPGDRTPPTADR